MLKKCYECSHDISDSARACPHCGCRLWYEQSTSFLAKLIGYTLICVGLIFSFYSFTQLQYLNGQTEHLFKYFCVSFGIAMACAGAYIAFAQES